ncbi:MAG: cation-translocating P-type ATPase [Actinomycetota bacterium]
MTDPDPTVANRPGDAHRDPELVGLTAEEARAGFERSGANEIPTGHRASWERRFLKQLLEPMSLLLLVAAAVEEVGLGERLEASAILIIVVLNAVIGTIQEGRAERALDALRSMEPRYATVIRDGRRQRIDLARVVPGDAVILAAGDRVPADVELLTANGLQIDESMLTGESLPVEKRVGDPEDDDAGGRAFAGTVVTNGEGLGVVVATGASSSLGRIAAELGEERAPTPLQRQLRKLTKTLGLAAVAIAGGVFALTLARLGTGEDQVRQAFLSAVALAVAAVPEGLPVVVTVVLALGVRRMAERGAIVRRLPAVETLGSSTVILTDKTGTLTENRMQVDRIVLPGDAPVEVTPGSVPDRLASAIALGSDATLDPPIGDPLEVALLEAVGEAEVRRLRDRQPRLASLPFDSTTRRTVTVSEGGASRVAVMKGAPEVVLDASSDALGQDGLPASDRDEVLRAAEVLASAGSRVIAFAVREGPDIDPTRPPEEGFSFLGLVGLRDPVRAEAATAVAAAAADGIRIVMVTGDHAGTAASVSREVGLLAGDGLVVEGNQLDAVDADDVSVFARVKPEDKLAIVRAFQERGQIVAVTGDGVNDAPALRQADIGVAMGRTGSDVAREAADMVITDDDLGTIVHAVEEGRRLFANIRNVIDYLVAGNLSEVAVVVGALLLFPTAGATLTPLQILWINLLTDGLPAVALGTDADPGMGPAGTGASTLLSWARTRMLAVRGISIAVISVGTFVVARFVLDLPGESARTAMFTVLVLSHLLYGFAVHLDRSGGTPAPIRSLLAARGLLIAVGGGIVLQLAVVAVPFLHDVFDTTALSATAWVLCVAASLVAPVGILLASRIGPRAGP